MRKFSVGYTNNNSTKMKEYSQGDVGAALLLLPFRIQMPKLWEKERKKRPIPVSQFRSITVKTLFES